MRFSWILWVVLLLGCDAAMVEVDAGPPPVDAGPTTPPEDLDGFIEWQMAHGGIPGAAVAILEGQEISWIGTYGYADIAAERLVDPSTLFIVASISKTIAVTRAMQLVESGAIDLDAPIETYVPYNVRNPAHPDAAISLRLLFTHTSSLEDDFFELSKVSGAGDPTETLTGFAQGYVTPGGAYYGTGNFDARAPGTRRSYCNAAFGIIGDAIERAGGASFRAQTSAGIFDVIDMDGAGWFLADVDAARLAVPYAYNGRTFSAVDQQGFAFYPAGSLRVSITGLSRFLLAIGNGGALGTARVLSEASVTEMLRPQFPTVSGNAGLSWSERTVNGHVYIGHSGETSGGSAQMLWSREGTHGIIVLTNSDAYLRDDFGQPEGREAIDAILSRLDEEARLGL